MVAAVRTAFASVAQLADRCERGGLRDELLNGEIFHTLRETRVIIES